MCWKTSRKFGWVNVHTIHDWKIVDRKSSPENGEVRVAGKLFGHSRFAPGDPITTSPITGYRENDGSTIVKTRNSSEYLLGKPSTSEPLANRRLIAKLKKRDRLSGRTRLIVSLVLLVCALAYALLSNAQDIAEHIKGFAQNTVSHHVLTLKEPETAVVSSPTVEQFSPIPKALVNGKRKIFELERRFFVQQ